MMHESIWCGEVAVGVGDSDAELWRSYRYPKEEKIAPLLHRAAAPFKRSSYLDNSKVS